MKRKLNLRMLILAALFAAATAVGAFIRLPAFIPMTLQTMFVVAAGVMLGPKYGALSQLIYVALGLIGLPVFTQGGGPAYVLKPSFGYLLGFILGAFAAGWAANKLKKWSIPGLTVACLIGLIPVYGIGLPYMYIIVNAYMGLGKSVWYVLTAGFLNVILSDLISCVVVALAAVRLAPILRQYGQMRAKKE